MNVIVGRKKRFVVDDDTLLYYPFTTDASDISGNGNHGTGVNVSYSPENGAFFSRDVSYSCRVKIPSSVFTNRTKFTISCWIKTPVAQTGNQQLALLYNWSFYYRYILFALYGERIQLYVGNGSTAQTAHEYPYSPGTSRHYYVITRDGANVKLYIDGVLVDAFTASYNPTSGGNSEITIGGNANGDSEYAGNGYIKDYILEARIWSDNDVLEYYNFTKWLYGITS